jgi:hypothetical protein
MTIVKWKILSAFLTVVVLAVALLGASGVRLKSECGSGVSSEVCFIVLNSSQQTLFSVTPTVITANVPINTAGVFSIIGTPPAGVLATPTSGQCSIGFTNVASVSHLQAQCFPSGGSLGPLMTLDVPLLPSLAFASLGSPTNGTEYYCSDCKNVIDNAATAGAACANTGSGAVSRRENGHWACN